MKRSTYKFKGLSTDVACRGTPFDPTLEPMNQEHRLNSWKEIGAYLERDARTAQRWEKEEGLPVHRHSHRSRASVFAYPAEIDAWRASRHLVPEAAPRPLWRIPAFALTLALCLITVGNGIRPQAASAQVPGQSARQVWSGAGVDPMGTPSFDGKYLSFTDWGTGNLAIRDFANGVSRILTKNQNASQGYPEYSVLSPDGRQVAYVWFNPDARGASPYELRVMTVGSGGEPKVLPWGGARYSQPTGWTPDGKQLLVIRTLQDRTIQLAMVSTGDGAIRTLKSLGWSYPRRASLSPDGQYIAYDIPGADTVLARDIAVLSADGSQETRVVEGAADDYRPLWTPDGSRVIFSSDRTGTASLWSIAVREGKPAGPAELLRKGTEAIFPLGLTADGTMYYFMGGPRRNFQTVELDSNLRAAGSPSRVSERFVDASGRAAWSRDGKFLAYYAYRGGPRGAMGSTTLVVRSVETGQERDIPLRLVMDDTDGIAPPRWFPDGGSVLVVAGDDRSPSPRTGYYRVRISTGEAELLHFSGGTGTIAQNPDLSPDGKILYYGDAGNIVRLDLESRRTSVLTGRDQQKRILSYAVSPDGRNLAYLVAGEKWGSAEVMPAAGGPAREVIKIEPWSGISLYYVLGWSSDGQSLLFSRSETDERDTDLYTIPLAGGEPRKVGVRLTGRINFPSMHPDGGKLLYSTRELGANEVWALENFLPEP